MLRSCPWGQSIYWWDDAPFCGRSSNWNRLYFPSPLVIRLQVTWACYPCWVGGRWLSSVHLWRNIFSVETWILDYCWHHFFLLLWNFPIQLDCHCFFPYRLGRLGCIMFLGVGPPFVLGHWGLKRLIDFSAISACLTSSRYDLWWLSYELLLYWKSYADMFEATWARACLWSPWGRDCETSQYILTWILLFSGH